MSIRMTYGEVWNGLPQSTLDNICSTDYMPISCLRRSHIFYSNVDPSALGEDKTKQEVVPVTEIDEWLELFMIYSAARSRRFPMEGHQLISYMKHVKTIAQRKGSDVAIEYDGQFRLQRLPERVVWDDFQYDIYGECRSYCESKRKRVQKPFRAGRRTKMCPFFVLPSTKATVHDQTAVTVTYAPSVNDLATVSQPVESSHINQQRMNLQIQFVSYLHLSNTKSSNVCYKVIIADQRHFSSWVLNLASR